MSSYMNKVVKLSSHIKLMKFNPQSCGPYGLYVSDINTCTVT